MAAVGSFNQYTRMDKLSYFAPYMCVHGVGRYAPAVVDKELRLLDGDELGPFIGLCATLFTANDLLHLSSGCFVGWIAV